MRAKAIVIGIDQYPHDDWCLDGAVRDALTFARWAVASGGVKVEDLTLLLAPRPDAPVDVSDLGAEVLEATEPRIRKVLQAFKLKAAGKGVDRLYFFYAGHGLSAPGKSPASGPLMIPSDVDDVEVYLDAPLGMEEFREAMQAEPPGEQVYFVDACRDALPLAGSSVATQSRFWDVKKTTSDELATQAVLLATTAGQQAIEIHGRGVFSKVLIKGLQGLGPRLDEPLDFHQDAPRQRLVFNELFRFVESALEEELGGKDVQVPYMATNKGGVDLTLADFGPSEIPLVDLTFFVRPAEAHNRGSIEFIEWSRPDADWRARRRDPAPAELKAEVTMRSCGGIHRVRVRSEDFEGEIPKLLVYEERRLPLELRPRVRPPVGRGPQDNPRPTLESISFAEPWDDAASDDVLEAAPARATLAVSSPDRLTRVAIFDGSGREIAHAYREVVAGNLAAGPYRVTAALAGQDRVEAEVVVEAGKRKDEVLRLPAREPGAGSSAVAGAAGIQIAGAYCEPSENFGPVGAPRLGSLLAYAAWAARWPDGAGFEQLRSLGVDRLPNLEPDGCAIQIVVADADADAVVAAEATISASGDGEAPRRLALVRFPGVAFAAQGAMPVQPGGAFVTVGEHTIAVQAVRGFVSAVIVSRERGEKLAIEQYLNPIDPLRPAAPGLALPLRDDVRLVELSWRALEEDDRLDDIEYQDVVAGARANPLLTVLAGYRMWRTERAGTFAAGPLQRMLELLPDLPDVHILAGLYDHARRDEHFERAARTGTPIAGAGFRALVEWMTRHARHDGQTPLELRRKLVPGTAWTAWTGDIEPMSGDAVRVIAPTGRPYRDRAPLDAVRAIAGRVGLLDAGGVQLSCVILNPSHILCPRFAIEGLLQRAPDGSQTLPAGAVSLRLDGPQGPALAVSAFLGPVMTLPAGSARSLCPCVLELARDIDRALPDLHFCSDPPVPGQRIALIGFPRFVRPDMAFAAHFASVDGVRHMLIGTVLEHRDDAFTFDYDCYGAPGVAGGPVIDLEEGYVIGIHAGANESDRDRHRYGLATTTLAGELARRTQVQ